MYVNFISHNAKLSSSSEKIFDYLQKENDNLNDKSLLLNNEYFFSNDFNIVENNGSQIHKDVCVFNIDNNLSSSHKTSQSKFYALNVSPSNMELLHLEKQADLILNERGLYINDKSTDDYKLYYNEQKNILIDVLLKDYTNDLMSVYAESMNREIYVDSNNLPNEEEYKNLNKIVSEKFENYLINEGVLLNDKTYIDFDKYFVKNDFNNGSVFNLYLEELDIRTDFYIPNNKFKIENNKLFIEEKYYIDRINNIKELSIENNQQIEISDFFEVKEDYINYSNNEKYYIKHDYEIFNKQLNIYFTKDEIDLKSGSLLVNEKIYNDKVYEAKINFLSKEFKDVKDNFLDIELKKSGFDLTKSLNETGKLEYVNPLLVPNKNKLESLKTIASVNFNKYLIEKGYLEQKEIFKISNWNDKKYIKADIILESDKAKLLEIFDSRLEKPQNIWIPNFVLSDKDDKKGVLNFNEKGEVLINSEFYEHKINEELDKKNSKILNFENYSSSISETAIKIKNKDSLKLNYEIVGLKEKVSLNISKEDLTKNNEGKYFIQKSTLDYKYQKSVIEASKKEFKEEFKKIEEKVFKEDLQLSKFSQKKKIENEFKDFLKDKNILEKEVDNNYKVQAEIVKTDKASSLITMKSNEIDVSFWVNNKSISSSNETHIFFKNEKEITKLINSAVERTQDSKKLISIQVDKNNFETSLIKNEKGEKEEIKIYQVKHNSTNLGELKFKVAEKDLVFKGEQVFIENGKLQYKLNQAETKEINIKYGEQRENIKKEVWKERGFNPEKRKLTKDDLMYYAKIENQRTYKSTNKMDAKLISNNKIIQGKIDKLLMDSKGVMTTSIKQLQSQFHRDKYTNEIIKEGVVKGGNNKHVHIVVSKYDATMPKHLKSSLSPMANQKESFMPNGKEVGFNRDAFFKKSEKLFDHKFQYSRTYENSYQYKNEISKVMKLGTGITKPIVSEVVKEIQKEMKNPISQLKQEINPIGKLKQELKFVPFPTSIPKGKLDVLIKVGKFIVQSIDKGLKM